MSTASLLMVVAVTWSAVGFVVALFLGRLFRHASRAPEEIGDLLVC